jgi:hypothetical protein
VNEILLTLVLTSIVAAAWYCLKPPAVFVVRVRAGAPEATQGTVTAAFLAAVAEVCREFNLSAGEVRGVARGRRIALRFSSHFSNAARQRLRNWWAMSGWSAPATRPPRSRGR